MSKKILAVVDDDVDKAFRQFLHATYGPRSKGFLSHTVQSAMVMFLKSKGYLKDKKTQE